MLNMYIGKNIVKVDESNLLSMDINVLKGIPYNVAYKYAEYISALEVCIEDILDIPTDIHDEVTYMEALVKLETIIKEEEAMVVEEVTVEATNKNNKEESVMKNMNAAVEELGAMAGIDININPGETIEENIERVDNALNGLKEKLFNTIDCIRDVLGLGVLHDNILDIIEEGTQAGTSKKSIKKMAIRCEELIEDEIEALTDWGEADTLKKAVQLKTIVQGDRNKSIFEAFASGCIYIAKKVCRRLRKWFAYKDEKSVYASICRGIAGCANIARKGLKLIWGATKKVVSYATAFVIKVGDFLYRNIMALVEKIKAFVVDKFRKLTNKDAEEDFEDDLDDDFFVDEE